MKHLEKIISSLKKIKKPIEVKQVKLPSPEKSNLIDFQVRTIAYSQNSSIYREQ